MDPVGLPRIVAWHSRVGLVEEYEYPCGRADVLPTVAHRELKVCLSLDFPGRYFYRGKLHDVPVGAVSVLDSWEPHAASDPCDRVRPSHYVVLYVDAEQFRGSVDLPPGPAIAAPIRTERVVAARFRALHRALASPEASPLEQDERLRAFAAAVLIPDIERTANVAAARIAALARARDYIADRAAERLSLSDVAAVADLSPWHFIRTFRRRFGMPPHRFQLWMKIDRARRLLAAGTSKTEVAHLTGFADQSHFTRCFKRMMRTTPTRYCMRS